MLVTDGQFGIPAPMVRRRNPKSMFKADGSQLVVFELFARSRKEGINGGFVHHRAFLKAFALYRSIPARSGTGNEVNARVLAAKIAVR